MSDVDGSAGQAARDVRVVLSRRRLRETYDRRELTASQISLLSRLDREGNIPVALGCAVLGALRLPRTAASPRGRSLASTIDLPGIALFTATLVSLLLFLIDPWCRAGTCSR